MARASLVFNYSVETDYSVVVDPFGVEVVGRGTNLQKELRKRGQDKWRLCAAGVMSFEIVLFWERLSAIEEAMNETSP